MQMKFTGICCLTQPDGPGTAIHVLLPNAKQGIGQVPAHSAQISFNPDDVREVINGVDTPIDDASIDLEGVIVTILSGYIAHDFTIPLELPRITLANGGAVQACKCRPHHPLKDEALAHPAAGVVAAIFQMDGERVHTDKAAKGAFVSVFETSAKVITMTTIESSTSRVFHIINPDTVVNVANMAHLVAGGGSQASQDNEHRALYCHLLDGNPPPTNQLPGMPEMPGMSMTLTYAEFEVMLLTVGPGCSNNGYP